MIHCPSRDQLHRLLAGSDGDESRCAIETHVKNCPACCNALAELGDATAVAEWRRRLSRRAHALGAEELGRLEEVLEELKSNPPPEIERSQSDETAAPNRFPCPPSTEFPLGRLGSYVVHEQIGQGTFGTVYKAFDCRLSRAVALKVLNPRHAAIPSERARFEREARSIARLVHDHIVRIYDVGNGSDFAPYLVMEFVDGPSLSDQLSGQRSDGRGAFVPRRAAEIVREVALALSAAHQAGLVHRDVKCSNILLETSTGRAKVTDFGVACELVAQDGEGRNSAFALGTLAYMSPEQVLSPQRVDARSDVYSLGVVLYELLTGERPFRGTSRALVLQVAHDDPQAPRELNTTVPRELETICLKCLEKEPDRRYVTAASLAEDLQRFLSGEPIRARTVRWWERAVICRALAGFGDSAFGRALHAPLSHRKMADQDEDVPLPC